MWFWGVLAAAIVVLALFHSVSGTDNSVPNATTNTVAPSPAQKPLTQQELKAKTEADAISSPEAFLTLSATSAWKSGFDTVVMLSGTLKNRAPIRIKDPQITCELFAESDTAIGSVTDTVYKVIPAGKSVRFKSANMGFADSRWQKYSCAVVSATADRHAR